MAGPLVYLDDVLVPNARIRLRNAGDQGISGLTQAANGSGGQGAITFEDPTHDFDDDVKGWTPTKVVEPLCTAANNGIADATRIFTGYVAAQDYARGAHYRDDGTRQIDVTINDTNVLLWADVFRGAQGKRPSETEVARMAWLLGVDQLGGLVNDFGFVDTSTGIVLDATDYVDQSPGDVINDMLARRADNIFGTYWSNPDDGIGLFYASATATNFTCPLSFTNDLSEVDNDTVFFAYLDPSLDSSPDEVYCREIFKYTGGQVMVHSATTHAAFFSWMPSGMHRTKVDENTHVGKATTATNWANFLLNHHSIEYRLVKFRSRLPASRIGLVQAAMRVNLHFLHLPELDPAEYRRIESVTIYPTEGRRDLYDIEIEASKYGLRIPGGGGGGGPTKDGPHQPPPPANIVELCIPSNANVSSTSFTVAVGQFVYIMGIDVDVTLLGTSGWHLWIDSSGATDPDTGPALFAPILTMQNGYPTFPTNIGTWNSPDASGDAGMHPGGAGGPGWDEPNETGSGVLRRNPGVSVYDPLYVYKGLWECTSGGGGIQTGNVGLIGPGTWYIRGGNGDGDGYFSEPGYSACVRLAVSDLAPPDFWASAPGEGDPGPLPLQWVYGEVVTMTGDTGTTAFSYQPGSLIVYVSGVKITTASYTETDPEAGTFTLAWTPDTDEVVKVDYQGHA